MIISQLSEKKYKKQNKNDRREVFRPYWSHSVAVSTTDFESVNPGSNPGGTFNKFLHILYRMTNLILYKSSCVNGSLIAILLAYAYFKNLLPKYIIAFLLTVIITSIINHKTTNKVAKWCDRVFAFITIVALGCYIYTNNNHSKSMKCTMFALLFVICTLYLIAKQKQKQGKYKVQNQVHLLTHICATILMVLIIFQR